MDAPGPLSRSVRDSARLLSLIAGPDAQDPTTSRRPMADYSRELTGDVRGLRLGVIRELTSGAETNDEIRGAVEATAARLGQLGATVEPVSLPLIPLAGAVFMAIADSEGAGLHVGWLRDRPGDSDAGTRRRLLAAGLLPAALYHQAQRARALIRQQVHLARGPRLRAGHRLAPPPAAAVNVGSHGRRAVRSDHSMVTTGSVPQPLGQSGTDSGCRSAPACTR
jgi:aspartyl-tRNA(Asn)/glutamyl-tRNA(Gln) amidotransferase subunit A